MFIDCHAHLYYPEATKESLDSLISSAKSSKVDYIVGNIWDNGYPDGGNYWDNYNGTDSDGDGIGDTPYNISNDGSKRDRYPLIQSKISI